MKLDGEEHTKLTTSVISTSIRTYPDLNKSEKIVYLVIILLGSFIHYVLHTHEVDNLHRLENNTMAETKC